ncbi:hypothetical protein OIU84_019080 [Salix udensis]|uniref:Uncharacterized protein n=1 Tax=Salix udensis TaxID=889485 RepID=A0AAD6PJ67_9ROSI|nr:hypothetical protein OIU84_019080 [Salix udensis]
MVGAGVEGSHLMVASLESVVATLVEEVAGGTIPVGVVMVVEDFEYMACTSLQLVQARWCHQASLNLSREQGATTKRNMLSSIKELEKLVILNSILRLARG